MRRAAHVDANQKEIVDALRAVGALVTSLAAVGKGVPDLLVKFRGRLHLLEVKNVKGRGRRLTEAQKGFHAAWEPTVVTSIDEAIAAIIGGNDGGQ